MSPAARRWRPTLKAAIAIAMLIGIGAYLWHELAGETEPFSRVHLAWVIVALVCIRSLFYQEGRLPARTLRELLFRNRGLLPLPVLLLALLTTDPRFPGNPLTDRLFDVGALLVILAGHGVRVWAIGHAGRRTRTTSLSADRLVTSGPYAHVRNPIYIGNWLIGVGLLAVAKIPWLVPLGLGFLYFYYRAVVAAEEAFLREKFGDEYERYFRAVPRFWPRWRAFNQEPGAFDRTIWRSKEYQALLASMAVFALLECVRHLLPIG